MIAFSAFGTEGNVNSIIAIAKLVAEHAEVCIATHSIHASKYEYTGIPMLACDDLATFRDMDAALQLLNTPRDAPEFFRRFVVPFSIREADALTSRLARPDGLVVTTDAPGIGARFAAEHAGVPVIALLQAPGFLKSREAYAQMLEGPLSSDVNMVRRAIGLTTEFSLQSWTRSATLSLALWPSWFRSADITQEGVTHTNFVWFDRDNCGETIREPYDVLVTGGSALVSGNEFYAAAIAGCCAAGAKTIVVAPYDHLLPPLRSGIHKRKWINVRDSLEAVKLVIHHGGIGTTIDAIRAGVPQLVMAAGGDRPENGRIVDHLGIGKCAPRYKWSAAVICQLIHELELPTFACRARSLGQDLINGADDVAKRLLDLGSSAMDMML